MSGWRGGAVRRARRRSRSSKGSSGIRCASTSASRRSASTPIRPSGVGEQVVEEHDETGEAPAATRSSTSSLTGRATLHDRRRDARRAGRDVRLHRRSGAAAQGDRRGGRHASCSRSAAEPGGRTRSRRGSGTSPRCRRSRPSAGTRRSRSWRTGSPRSRAIRRSSTTSPAPSRAPGGRSTRSPTCSRRSRGDAKWAERAKTDPDFDPIRREPGFPA